MDSAQVPTTVHPLYLHSTSLTSFILVARLFFPSPLFRGHSTVYTQLRSDSCHGEVAVMAELLARLDVVSRRDSDSV